jgi:hypothetical protein
MHDVQDLFRVLAIIFVLYFVSVAPFYLYILRRDQIFNSLAKRYGLTAKFAYKHYPFWGAVPLNILLPMRTLSGEINHRSIVIEDRVTVRFSDMWSLFLNRSGDRYGPFIYLHAPTHIFGQGAQTIVTYDGGERSISKRSFWTILGFARQGDIESFLLSINNSRTAL